MIFLEKHVESVKQREQNDLEEHIKEHHLQD
jgi:hypothetical protein